jgi:hypothetical protein
MMESGDISWLRSCFLRLSNEGTHGLCQKTVIPLGAAGKGCKAPDIGNTKRHVSL